jgi:hypothetical protein
MDDTWSEFYESVEGREDSSRHEATAFTAQSRRDKPYASLTAAELLSSNSLPGQAPQPHARKRGSKDLSTKSFTQMTGRAPVAPDAERSSSNSSSRRPRKASSRDSPMQMVAPASDAEAGPATSFLSPNRSMNSLSSTAAPAASNAGRSLTSTLLRRPSKEHGYEASTISTSLKRQNSNQLTRTKNKRQSRGTAKPDAPSGSPGQADQLSGGPDIELPTATENPDSNLHVKLLDPNTLDINRPIFLNLDQELHATERLGLKAWFAHLMPKRPDEFRPWWNKGPQNHIKCPSSKVVSKRDSVWNGIFACELCASKRQPCLRFFWVVKDGQWKREIGVLPRSSQPAFGNWSAPS